MAIFGPIWTQFRSKQLKIWPESHFWLDRVDPIDPIDSIWSEMAFWPNFKLFRPKFSPNWTKNGVFSLKTCVFRRHFSIFEYRILYRTCFAKFPRIRKYRIYSGLNSNMKKKNVSSFAKMENPEKKSFRIALLDSILLHYHYEWQLFERIRGIFDKVVT